MKLNCKAGDLAIVVRSSLGNIGKIVKVRCLYFDGYKAPNGGLYRGLPNVPTWIVECDGGLNALLVDRSVVSYKERPFSDGGLRPIRNQPGDDETLTWAGLPQDAGVTA